MYGADMVSINATTSGVTGTITVPSGAKLRNLSLSYVAVVNVPDTPIIIELTWANSPTPLRFTPNVWGQVTGTSVTGGETTLLPDESCLIPLDVTVQNATTVTVKVTSTGNITVKIGLEWD